VTTISKDGKHNAAPMGVVRRDDSLLIRMFPGSKTLQNVRDTRVLVANVMPDPMAYVISAFGDLDESMFVLERGLIPPKLKDAWAWAYFTCAVGPSIKLTPVRAHVARTKPPAYSRGFAAVIEAVIVGTRLRFYKDDEGTRKILEYGTIVDKCGAPRDIEAFKKLKEILKID
jgi:uncharacterized protein